MKKLLVMTLALFVFATIPHDALATSYYYPNYSTLPSHIQSRVQSLLQEVARLQAEIARIHDTRSNECYWYGNTQYCYQNEYRRGSTYTGNIRSIDVDYRNSAAYVTVEYRSGSDREYIVGGADTNSEVIDAMADTLNLSRSEVASIISFSGSHSRDRYDDDDDDDIDYIRVTIDRDDDDARALVRYEDGDTDTYTYNTDKKDDIIEELSDDLDISENKVEDLIIWRYDDSDDDDTDFEDIDSIEADIDEDDNRTNVRVEYDNNKVRYYTYHTDDEDEVIEELSDDLDIDEDDIEDIIDFDYI